MGEKEELEGWVSIEREKRDEARVMGIAFVLHTGGTVSTLGLDQCRGYLSSGSGI